MILGGFPAYCGGRILYGLYDSGNIETGRVKNYPFITYRKTTDKDIIEKSLSDQKTLQGDWWDTDIPPPISTKKQFCNSVPKTLKGFQFLLGRLCQMSSGSIGTICAVTNDSQNTASKFLLSTGFKVVKESSKLGKLEEENDFCKFFVASYFDDIEPIVSKLDYKY